MIALYEEARPGEVLQILSLLACAAAAASVRADGPPTSIALNALRITLRVPRERVSWAQQRDGGNVGEARALPDASLWLSTSERTECGMLADLGWVDVCCAVSVVGDDRGHGCRTINLDDSRGATLFGACVRSPAR